MFRNQYFVTNFRPDTDLDFRVHSFDDLFIFGSPDLLVNHERAGDREVVLLGYAIDPFAPEKDNHEMAAGLAGATGTQDVVRRAQALSGRFVIFYRDDDTKTAFSDALGHRQIYYYRTEEQLFLTSSPKLFLHVMHFDLQISDEKREITESQEFRRTENSWFGDDSIDDRLKKVTPNHNLDLEKWQVRRKAFDVPRHDTKQATQDLCAQVLTGGLAGAVRRYRVMQAVTAGVDSRVLLAASKEVSDKIQYYIFKRPGMSAENPDIAVPLELAKKIDIDFQPLTTEPLNDEFIEAYKIEHILPRILSKTQNIQHHYYNSLPLGNVLDVKGNGGEVLRFFYGRAHGAFAEAIGPDVLMHLSGYPGNAYFERKMAEWLSNAKGFARQYGIPILDLFYWEQRMGNWGAEHGLEQDIAVEEFWPFNNAALLLNGLTIHHSQRAWPKYVFFLELMSDLWPEVLSEPINPKKNHGRKIASYLNGYVKSKPHLEYFAKSLASRLSLKR
jgi:hypothetical protein